VQANDTLKLKTCVRNARKMKCRNYDCIRELGDFEIKKMAKVPYPLQSKFNYCVRCRRVDAIINRIQCHYCKSFMGYTSLSRHICNACKKERVKTRLYNTRTAPNNFISKQKKLLKLLLNGVYTKAELIKELNTTDYSLHNMLNTVSKTNKIERVYTIK
jgi:hypothetical protein